MNQDNDPLYQHWRLEVGWGWGVGWEQYPAEHFQLSDWVIAVKSTL